jgi:hypothetical protein
MLYPDYSLEVASNGETRIERAEAEHLLTVYA